MRYAKFTKDFEQNYFLLDSYSLTRFDMLLDYFYGTYYIRFG